MKLNKILKIILVAVIVFLGNFTVNAATTGSITIDNAANGKTYAIYKLFDATVTEDGTGISYKVPAGKTLEDSNQWFRKDSAGNVFIKDGITSADLDTPEFKQWALGFGEKVGDDKTSTNGASVVFSAVPFGYYFVTSTLDGGKYISVDSTMPDVVIKDKNDNNPTIDPNDKTAGKTIRVGENDDQNGRVMTANYGIGDKVPFQIKFTATNFVTKNRKTEAITEYRIVDTPTNLKILKDTLVVKVGNRTLTLNTDYTVSIDTQSGAMTVIIPWINKTDMGNGKINGSPLYNPTETVVLTYESLVLPGAATSPATNRADISYKKKNDPTVPEDPNSPDPLTPVDPKEPRPDDPTQPDPNNPKITTYKLTIKKVDGVTNSALTGAKFKLYDAATQGSEIRVVKENDYYRLAAKDENGNYTEEGVEILVENTNGTVEIKGLKGLGTYHIEETLAPAGYNRLTTRTAATTVSEDDPAVAADVLSTILNQKGIELPSTGGIGRTIFYVVGSVLVVGVVITMISRIKMKSVK